MAAGSALSRRAVIAGAGALLAAPALIRSSHATVLRDPFSLGVASGYPASDGFVLWTRLAPEPLHPLGGLAPDTMIPVECEVALDEGFRTIVAREMQVATPDWAHSVHVELFGLEPGRDYFYRFHAAGATSPIGRTKTAPAQDATPEALDFCFVSCQHFEQGYFNAYRHIVADVPDLIVHLGDYIYESSWGREHVRRHDGPEPYTLDDYRRRHALYKSDPDLKAAHAVAPWAFTWDDHEVDNDYAGAISEQGDEPDWFLRRRAAAYKAYYEHMPLRREMVAMGPHLKLFTRLDYGRLATFHMVDDRQYRDPQPCPEPGEAGARLVALSQCAGLDDPSRSLLGRRQEAWLEAGLRKSEALWNVIGQQTWLAETNLSPKGEKQIFTDGWDGYPAARRRLTDVLASGEVKNPVAIGGDVHSFWFGDIKQDHSDPNSKTVASQFIGGSVTSQLGFSQETLDELVKVNPHIAFANKTKHGYVRTRVTSTAMTADVRVVDSVTDRDAAVSTMASFAVEAGKPGLALG